ncbi:MAG: hypothetical protein J0M17_25945 [Planctomycetes bacterium]|nr:hypothetical protein [Planctomycetota bacterium]
MVQTSPNLLWRKVHELAGVSRSEYDAYFRGCDLATAIQIADVTEFRDAVSLEVLREIWCGFHPPQGFRYLDAGQIARLPIAARRRCA